MENHIIGLCPYCGQDYVLKAKVKKTGQIIKICPECYSLWEGDVLPKCGSGYEIFVKEHGLRNNWDELEIIGEC